LFEQWLATHFPERKEKVLARLTSLRGGKLYDAQFGKRMTGEGIFAEQITQLFTVACRRAGSQTIRHSFQQQPFGAPAERSLDYSRSREVMVTAGPGDSWLTPGVGRWQAAFPRGRIRNARPQKPAFLRLDSNSHENRTASRAR
jgi:hypothetical protein